MLARRILLFLLLLTCATLPHATGCILIDEISQCFNDNDCSTGQICQKNECVGTEISPFCPVNCNEDSDCTNDKCSGVRRYCIGGTCQDLAKWQLVDVSQAAPPKIDLLFVIDNSDSMKEEQNKLAANFKLFVDELKKTNIGDLHVGVVATDAQPDAPLGTLIRVDKKSRFIKTREVPQSIFERQFASTIQVGVQGSSIEKPLEAMRLALSPKKLNDPNHNGGFLRDDSLLVILFVGDEDDCSYKGPLQEVDIEPDACRFSKQVELKDSNGNYIINAQGKRARGVLEDLEPVSTYINFLKGLQRSQIIVAGLIGNPSVTIAPGLLLDPNGCKTDKYCRFQDQDYKCVHRTPTRRHCGGCTGADANATPGYRLYEVIKAFGGENAENRWFSICGNDNSFGRSLVSIARSISFQKYTATLPTPPLLGSLNRIAVQLIPKDQNQPAIYVREATTIIAADRPKTCSRDADCGGTYICDTFAQPSPTCRGDGWVYFPPTSYDKAMIKLSGQARQDFTFNKTLRIEYLTRPNE